MVWTRRWSSGTMTMRGKKSQKHQYPCLPPRSHTVRWILSSGVGKEKFLRMMECLREVQMTSEKASSDMWPHESRARAQGQEHERRLVDFLRKAENIRIPTTLTSTLWGRARPKYARNSGITHHQWDETRLHTEKSTRCRTPGVRAQRIRPDSMETHMGSTRSTLPHIGSARTGDHDDAFGDTRNTLPHTRSARTEDHEDAFGDMHNTLPHTSSARTGEQPMFRDTRTREHDDAFGDTRTRDTATTETRAVEIYNFVWMNNLHTRMTGGTVGISNRAPTTLAMPHRFHASHQARKSRHLMEQIQPSFVHGLFNLRPSRAIRAGQQGNG